MSDEQASDRDINIMQDVLTEHVDGGDANEGTTVSDLIERLRDGRGIGAALSGDASFVKAIMAEAADALEANATPDTPSSPAFNGMVEALRRSLDIDGEGDALDNLEGAWTDMNAKGTADAVCLRTVARVMGQLNGLYSILNAALAKAEASSQTPEGWREVLKPFAEVERGMYESGHCGGQSPEDWPDVWAINITAGPNSTEQHSPQSWAKRLTVGDFRRLINAAALAKAEASGNCAEGAAKTLDYLLGERSDLHPMFGGTPNIRELCYSVFMRAKGKNDEDGGPTDWCNDTVPLVEEAIKRFRGMLSEGRK